MLAMGWFVSVAIVALAVGVKFPHLFREAEVVFNTAVVLGSIYTILLVYVSLLG